MKKPGYTRAGVWIAIGIGMGVAFGVALENMTMGIAIGLAAGGTVALIGIWKSGRK